MPEKQCPFTRERVEEIAKEYPTPFHIYDEKAIRQTARELKIAFAWAPRFTEYYAVKACPTPRIIQILAEEGFGADCSSMAELILAERLGITGEQVMFTSNDTPAEEYIKANALGAVINLDDISHIDYLDQQGGGLPELICFRYNPGALKSGNAIIGDPEQAKYGLTREQIFEAYAKCRDLGCKRFGLHTMVASNELDPEYHIETARLLFELTVEIHETLGIRMEFINLGGGIGVAYEPEQEPIDLSVIGRGIQKLYEEIVKPAGLDPLNICMESGRVITGPHGWLVSRVLHLKHTYKDYVGLDACMADLMRPALYDAYHHITVMGKEDAPLDHTYDVTGSLCENNDKFAIDRTLPEIEPGDLLAIHDAGAHGHAMGFNYNGKLRSAELLLREDGSIEQIRRAETLEDYFSTACWPG